MPPTKLTISTAGAPGAYHDIGLKYAERFASHGITLEVLESEGSQQNLELLRRAVNPADLALMQGGFGYLGTTIERRDRSRVETLANVEVEAVWLFTRNRPINSLTQLKGLRIAVGPVGGGSRKVALKLLEQARVDLTEVTLSKEAGPQLAIALEKGQIDLAFFVAPPSSSTLKKMLTLPGVQLVSLGKSAAITQRNPYLEPRLLLQGALGSGFPPRDVTMLTTSASLVAKEDLHPALKRLATAVTMEVHANSSSFFHQAGEFPSLRRIDFPTAPSARDTLAGGLPYLEDVLPFWWAQVIQRLLLIALPCALLALWLMQLVPAFLRWTLESRVSRWYGELKFIENDLAQKEVRSLDLTRFLLRLNAIDKGLVAFRCPKDLMERCYTLQQHVEFVRQRLYKRRGR